MNNKDLISAIAAQNKLSKTQTAALLSATADIIIEQLISGKSIGIANFGTLEIRKKNERVSVNPVTKTRTLIPPKLTLNFKQHATLKETLKNVQL